MKRPKCPICNAPCALDRSNPWRPFCSERCRLLDLSSWLGGDYAIPGPPVPNEQDRDDDR